MENVNAYLGLRELDVRNFAKKDIGDKIVINHVNAIVPILFVIQRMVAFVDQDIEVWIINHKTFVSHSIFFMAYVFFQMIHQLILSLSKK